MSFYGLERIPLYSLNPTIPETSSSGMSERRPWRRCSACRGVCHWHDEAWVCADCGAEWYADHDSRFKAPGACPAKGCEFECGHLADHPHGLRLR